MLLTEALIYLDMGFSVYPAQGIVDDVCTCGHPDCPDPGKHPVGSWSEFQHRLPTRPEVVRWFSSMPDANIGMVTGRISGVVVVDVDSKAGLQTIRTLGFQPTLSARTGGGGYHFFYATRERISSCVKFRRGVDIRGEGGYVVLPPSLHHSGRLYRWLRPRAMRLANVRLLSSRTQRYDLSDSERNADNWVNEILAGVVDGNRNVSAARLVGRYVTLGLSIEEAFMIMEVWNERNAPPLEDRVLKRTIRAIFKRHETIVAPIEVETLEQIRALLGGNGGSDRGSAHE